MELKPGCQIVPGAEITPPAKFLTGYAKLAVVDRRGNLMVRVCNAGEDCSPPLFMPKNQQPQPLWSALIEEVMRKLRGDPDRYVSAIGLGDGQLTDAVVQQASDTGTIDLASTMVGLAAGDYELELARLDNQHIKVRWDGVLAKASARSFSAGLYQVRVKGQNGSEAWVLITSGSASDAILTKEAALRELLKGWTGDADTEGRNARRTAYRAFLAEAAEEMYGEPR